MEDDTAVAGGPIEVGVAVAVALAVTVVVVDGVAVAEAGPAGVLVTAGPIGVGVLVAVSPVGTGVLVACSGVGVFVATPGGVGVFVGAVSVGSTCANAALPPGPRVLITPVAAIVNPITASATRANWLRWTI